MIDPFSFRTLSYGTSNAVKGDTKNDPVNGENTASRVILRSVIRANSGIITGKKMNQQEKEFKKNLINEEIEHLSSGI